jgi:hypothetical protein
VFEPFSPFKISGTTVLSVLRGGVIVSNGIHKNENILEEWDINEEYFTEVVRTNPSLRGMILGYIAEKKLKDLFVSSGKTKNHRKDDDHNRDKKGDLALTYQGEEIIIEVKSLQTNTISIVGPTGEPIPMMRKVKSGRKPSTGLKKDGTPKKGQIIYKLVPNEDFHELGDDFRDGGSYVGAFQCDASDRREIVLDNGDKVNTTLLKFGEFDVIAAGVFSFKNKWEFGFALNSDLPSSDRYGENSSQLIASLVNIEYPFKKPFESDPFRIFDRVLKQRVG